MPHQSLLQHIAKKIILSKLIIIIALTLMISQTVFATTIKLCGIHWPPFTFSEKQDLTHGLSIDIYTEAFKRLNMKIDAKVLPWQRCMKLVKHGSIDALIDNTPSNDFINGLAPTGFYPLAIYVRNDFKQTTFSWQAMKNKDVAMVKGYDYTDKISSFKHWNKLLLQSETVLVRLLKAKRYDYVLLDIFAAQYLEKKHDIKLKMLEPMVDSTMLYLVFNKNKQALKDQYDIQVIEMINDGTMDRLYLKYLPHSYNDFKAMMKESKRIKL